MNEYYLYAHRNPKTLKIFYIGIGRKDRATQFGRTKRSLLWRRYTEKHGLPIVNILLENLSMNDAAECEKIAIKGLGRIGFGGSLVNLTDGGEGVVGYKHSLEVIEKQRGRKLPEETKIKMSESHKQRFLTPESKLKMSEYAKMQKYTDERRLKLSKSLTGRKFSEDHKANISKSKKGKKLSLSNEQKQNWSDIRRGRVHTEATRLIISQSNKNRNLKPIDVFDLNDNYIDSFPTAVLAGKFAGVGSDNVSRVCKGKRISSGGYKFKYSICL